MPPVGRRIGDDFIDESDSDVSITGLDDGTSRAKGKGKGKAIDRRKKDKGKSKAKEVRTRVLSGSWRTDATCWTLSNHTHGKRLILDPGTLSRKMKRGGLRVPFKT